MKKCPNCGACQECGHAPNPWLRPLPWYGPQPYSPPITGPIWISPHHSGPWGNPTVVTYTDSTSGPYSA